MRPLASVAVALLALSGTPLAAAEGSDTEPKLLLMHYMPWYQTPEVSGNWGGHWTGWEKQHDPTKTNDEGLPDIWSNFHPLIGVYDSSDPDVIECHLLQMKLAGIDGVIVDWYGITDLHDYGLNHEATKVIFDEIDDVGMKFATCFEDRTIEQLVEKGRVEPDGVTERLRETFAWMDEHWFNDPRHVRVDDRPLLLDFGPIYVKDAEPWNDALGSISPRPMFFALHHLWKGIGADGGFTWVHQDVWKNDPTEDEIARRLQGVFTHTSDDPDRVIVSALPGFRDVYAHHYPTVEHRDGATLRETLGAAMRSGSPIVQLVTWNDYGEGTVIEPTHEFGYLFLEIIQEARRREIGESFTFTADDLRLPARLLELRRRGDLDDERLDRVARLLSRDDCRAASEAIEAME
ncbi:MAG: hypothetical protein CMJ31_13825 [Phycisphaerae bacterium]|nr:hypothetical protein [Phycisphaerae bacterium]